MSYFNKYRKENILLLDGAMGTYFAHKSGVESTVSEIANIEQPNLIREIHGEYINAGANLIRTNTFAANTISLNKNFNEVEKIIRSGVKIAFDEVKGREIFVAGSIGPIPDAEIEGDEIFLEYRNIIDVLLDEKIEIFWLETFSDYYVVNKLVDYIKIKKPSCVIVTMFSINRYGHTKKGYSKKQIIQLAKDNKNIDAYGFNCGIGSSHMYNEMKNSPLEADMVVAPNAGYPEKVFERTFYRDNSDYFKENILSMVKLGISIVGGCCGTTPSHIKKLSELLKNEDKYPIHKGNKESKKSNLPVKENQFYYKLKKGKKVIAVELDPPFGVDVSKIMSGAMILKDAGADLITIADSPLAKSRIDSISIASKIYREVGIETMPHISCRDKNVISLKSTILGAYVDGIRNYLLVTGDPVPSEDRSDIKSVFNVNSFQLMEFVDRINKTFENKDFIRFGGALNPNVKNMDVLIGRVKKKIDAGAEFLLTQPVYGKVEIDCIEKIKSETGIKILVGILPIVSYRNAQFLHNEFPGIDIPEFVRNRFNSDMGKAESEQVGIDIALEIIKTIGENVDGYYFMTPFNRATMIKKIIEKI